MIDGHKIDLHMHSTISDGTDTPEELLEQVRKTGLELFALTDHDAVKGYGMIRGLLRSGNPGLLTGVEFGCRDEAGKYHILGYGFDPDSPAILDVIDLGHRYRTRKLRARLEFLAATFGFTFPREEIDRLFALANPGKPHLGNLMVKYGYAQTKEQAINEFINRLRTPEAYVRPEDAIRGIVQSGGVPVLAHPVFGSGNELILGQELEDRVVRLMAFGLNGVEAFYSGFTPALRKQVLALAHKYDLYVTAGSDYHGTNKLVPLGDTEFALDQAMPEGMRRFLEEVRPR